MCSENDALELLTAPDDDVLPGVMRSLTLQAAAAEGLTVRKVAPAPTLAASGAWSEAAVTSALRGIQPLSSVIWPEGFKTAGAASDGSPSEADATTGVAAAPTHTTHFSGEAAVLTRLQQRVAAMARLERVGLQGLDEVASMAAAAAAVEEAQIAADGFVKI